MNRGGYQKGTYTITPNPQLPSTQNSLVQTVAPNMQLPAQKMTALSNSMGPALSQSSASTNVTTNTAILSGAYSGINPSSTPFSRQTTNSNIILVQEVKKKIYVPPPVSNKFKYYVGEGNNGELVVDIMSKRDWWELTESFNTLFNFKWQQGQRGYKYERLVANPHLKQCVNHFENHKQISTKDLLIKNLSNYCEVNLSSLFLFLDQQDKSFRSNSNNFLLRC